MLLSLLNSLRRSGEEMLTGLLRDATKGKEKEKGKSKGKGVGGKQFISHRMDVQRRLRHAEIRWEFLQHVIGRGILRLLWVKGSENPSDTLTKVLDALTQMGYRKDLGIVATRKPFDLDLSMTDQKNSKKKSVSTSSSSPSSKPKADREVIVEKGVVGEDGSEKDSKDEQLEVLISSVTETIFGLPMGTQFLLVELCCEEDSVLSSKWMTKEGHHAWRVTEAVDLRKSQLFLHFRKPWDR